MVSLLVCAECCKNITAAQQIIADESNGVEEDADLEAALLASLQSIGLGGSHPDARSSSLARSSGLGDSHPDARSSGLGDKQGDADHEEDAELQAALEASLQEEDAELMAALELSVEGHTD